MNKKIILFLGIVSAIALPLLPFLPMHNFLSGDYVDTHWMARYFTEYLKVHHHFPMVYNTFRAVNVIWPIFYGFLFFPLISILATLTGVDFAFRILFILLWTLKFALSFILVKKLTQDKLLSISIACMVIWTLYPLTNLFGRGAIGEVVATDFMFCGLCSWFLFLIATQTTSRILFGLLMGLCVTVGMASHAISLFFGTWFFLLIGVGSLPFILKQEAVRRRQILAILLLNLILCATVLSPWIYVNLHFSNILAHKLDYNMYWRRSIDSLLGRFSPLPIHWQMFFLNIDGGEYYVDAEANTPLLILAVGIFFAERKKLKLSLTKNPIWFLFLTSFLVFGFATFVSMSYSHRDVFATIASFAQFHFRFVTYINMAIFSGLMALLIVYKDLKVSKKLVVWCLSLSLIGCLIKSFNGVTQYNFDPATIKAAEPYLSFEKDKNKVLLYPFNSYGYFAASEPEYKTLGETELRDLQILNIPVLQSEKFGDIRPVSFNVAGKKPKWLETNIYRFPWTKVKLDGQELGPKDLRIVTLSYVFKAIPGNHIVESEFAPPTLWLGLRKLSFIAVSIWSLLVGCFLFSYFKRT